MNQRSHIRDYLPEILGVLVVLGAVLIRMYRLLDIPHTLWVDEAWLALKARDVVQGIDFVPIEHPGLGVGDSPMQVYLAAFVQLLGIPASYSVRIASSIIGSATVAVLYPMLADVWRMEFGELKSRWMALIGTLVLAGMFSHLFVSRLGNQNALSVIFTIVTVWLTLRALDGLSTWWAVAAGLALGLSQYTYESCRILPILVGALLVLWLVAAPDSDRRRHLCRVSLAIVLACAIAVLPLLYVYLLDPAAYVLHMRDVSSGLFSGRPLQVLGAVAQNYLTVVGGISFRGDAMPGRNLAGKPMLEPFLSLFCWLGVILSIHQFSKSRSSRLFITWLAIMLLPSALSDQAPAANRMLAAAPAAAALVARGFIWIWQKVWGWCRTRQSGASAIGIVWSCLLVTGLVLSQVKSTYDYFFQWATDPRLFDGLSMGPRLAAEQALELVKTDRVYFTPASDAYNRMINDLLLDGSPVREVEGAVCLPLVDRSSQAADYVVVTVADHDSLATLHEIYPAGEEIDAILHPDGYAYAVVFHVPAGQPGPAMQSRVAVGFVDGPTLVGYSIATQQKLRPGDSFELTLYWKGNPSHVTEAVSFVHVGKGQQSDPMVANHDARMCGGAYAALEWSADEVLVDRHTLAIASDAQGGVYDVAVGVYGSVDQRRFRVVSSDVPELDDRVFITQLQVEGP